MMGWGERPRGKVRVGLGRLVLAAVAELAVSGPVPSVCAQETAACAKAEFESAVDEAAGALRGLNNKNRPEFQNKLRQLKDKRHWDNDQFMKEAAPFVKDDQIQVYDDKSNELLASISSMGQEGASAKVPDCAVLTKLRDLMRELIDAQGSK